MGGGFLAASETSMVQAQSSIGEAQGIQHAASASNMSVTEQSELSSGVSHTMQTADAQSNLKNGGGQLSTLSDQQGKLHSTERETQLGHAAGTRQAASATGKSVTDFTQEKTATSAINEHASGQGQLQASGGTLGGLHSRSQYTAAAESDERQGRADALHNAYDAEGGIASGVSESQTEHLTQNLHDMREQKANIQEISKATGTTESQSREILSAARSAEQMGTLEEQLQSETDAGEFCWSTSKVQISEVRKPLSKSATWRCRNTPDDTAKPICIRRFLVRTSSTRLAMHLKVINQPPMRWQEPTPPLRLTRTMPETLRIAA